ncbi:amino acid transporter [Mytilinidion resinicola]|uniref:Amino acid transporter n=1 Tax=Mytilinidion resinicola TaxID=574789 RepID=A0A6A6ZAU1_9PEZI|nr:amino acid transporter [Mytilinidion resinicola]KAF2817414.1 amino acid transporter [Mytilinidion resinicola]
MAEKQFETTVSDDHVAPVSPESSSIDLEDKATMQAMGKTQQLKGSSLGTGLYAGGPVTLVWGLFFTGSGTLALACSIAEMASMCPISGAQYHWTYMFAPKKWKATITSLTYIIAGQVQGMVILNWADYGFERWHTTLMMWAVLGITYVINIYGIGLLPATELFAGVCHVFFFIIFAVVMLVLGRNSDAKFVFTTFINQTGWESTGVGFFIGLLPCIWCIIGFDGAIHMSEETAKAAQTIPRIIVTTVLINASLAWLSLLLFLFAIKDINLAISTPTGYAILEIFRQLTNSTTSATLMMCAMLTISIAAMFGTLASVSRLTWAFARDEGLPFSNYFKYVDPKYQIPTRAVSLVSVVIILLSLINIGSSVALNAVLSLSTIGLYISYIIPIACLLSLRLRVATSKAEPSHAGVDEDKIVFGPWTLGQWDPLINLYAICYATLLVPFMALPSTLPLTKETMNYAGPVFLLVIVFAGIDCAFRDRKHFHGPSREVQRAVQEG